ncbi:MAG: VOC family protein [Acetobacterales bacterium]
MPASGTCNLDHIGYFVADMEAAAAALERLGFSLSPFTRQYNRSAPDTPPAPAGTGNRLIVLEEGYIEVLAPTGEDTPVARQLHAALEKYPGLHLIAFGSGDADGHHAHLESAGFAPQPVVDLRRTVDGPEGMPAQVRFRVVRVSPGAMPEGRVQFCQHMTPGQVWRSDWMAHPNGATALDGVVVCEENPSEAAGRFARFTGIAASPLADDWRLRTGRGVVDLLDIAAFRAAFAGLGVPALPCIAALRLRCRSLPATTRCLEARGVRCFGTRAGLVVPPAEALGATLLFSESAP